MACWSCWWWFMPLTPICCSSWSRSFGEILEDQTYIFFEIRCNTITSLGVQVIYMWNNNDVKVTTFKLFSKFSSFCFSQITGYINWQRIFDPMEGRIPMIILEPFFIIFLHTYSDDHMYWHILWITVSLENRPIQVVTAADQVRLPATRRNFRDHLMPE